MEDNNMIDRTQQNWPDDITVNLIVRGGELKPLGRNLAMKMLLEKAADEAPELSPYGHELNSEGTACAVDCPACRWAAERNKGNQG